jgi:hypothetical protein
MTEQTDEPAHANAAAPWQEGEPEKRGRYLIEYEQYDQRRIYVADYALRRVGDHMKLQWASMPEDARVLRYARIHSPYTQYHE